MLRILILEDEPFIAMDLQLAFEDVGVEPHVAANCDAALAVADEIDLDGAVLDVNLGQGQTCAPVAALLRSKSVPFVLHTGDLDRQGEFLRDLDAPVIPKPTTSRVLVETVIGLLKLDVTETAVR